MFRKLLTVGAVASLFAAGLVAAPAVAAPQDNLRMSQVRESRTLTANTNFQAEADEKAVSISTTVNLSAAQYASIGSGKKLTIEMELTSGSAVVARENTVNVSGAITNSSWGSNTFLTNSTAGAVNLNANLEANLLPSTNYQVAIKVYVDGVLKTLTTDYTISSLAGSFSKTGNSVVADGTENFLSFRGETCLSPSAYTSLVAGDVVEMSVTDVAGHSYGAWADIWATGGNNTNFQYNGTSGKYEATITQQMLTDKVYINFSADASSPSAGTYNPQISVKKVGTSTELTEVCAVTPSAAPTLAATATGLTMTVDQAGAQMVYCYIADARYPNIWIQRTSAYSPQTSCSFSGLKRGDYVGWTERVVRISQTNSAERASNPSAKSTSVAYAGGNGSYRTYTGTAGGSGQGSLTLTDITYQGSDFNTERRASDGNGGLLVASIEAADNQLKLRQLTPSGMNASFGGSGVVTVDLPPVNARTNTPQLGWFGTSRDKWMISYTLPGAQTYDGYGVASGMTVFATGDYSGSNQTSKLLSTTDIARFCQSQVSGQDNVAQWAYLQSVISAPTQDPLLVVNCEIRHGNTGSYYSQVPFLATLANGVLVAKAALGDEPASGEKCSRTIVSAVNSGATGSEVMLASFQRTWNPSSSDCWTNGAVPSASVVSRDVFTVTNGYNRTAVRDVMTVSGTDEPVLGESFGMGSSPTMRLIVSGPNTHLLTSAVTGSSPNQVVKYRIARLTNSSFGAYEQQPLLTVASTDSFNTGTSFTQIADYSENEAASVLLSRSDYSTGSTAARVDLSTGAITTYQQMASSSVGMADGGSLILGNSSGALNFYGITSRTTAVLGQWTTTGAFDPALSALPINQGASNTGVSQGNPGPNPGPNQVVAPAAPYTGPVVKAPGKASPVKRGAKALLDGSSLSTVTKVEINGLDAKVVVKSDGQLEITVPAGLPAGTYDIVVTSASGKLTVQDAVVVGKAVVLGSPITPSTKLKEDDTVKVYVKDVVGAGKVQIMHNGVEIAWVSASSESDSKLRDGYLVRTIELAPGKNVIEVFVDGKRVDRKAYTKVDDSSRN